MSLNGLAFFALHEPNQDPRGRAARVKALSEIGRKASSGVQAHTQYKILMSHACDGLSLSNSSHSQILLDWGIYMNSQVHTIAGYVIARGDTIFLS